MKLLVLLTFSAVLVGLSHQKNRELFYYNVTFVANEKFINESKISIQCEVHTRERPCNYAPSVKFCLIQDIARLYAQIKATDVNRNRIILDQMLNICMFESQTLDLLIKVILDRLKNHLSFPIRCPFKKGLYETFAFKQDFGVFLNLFPINQPQRYVTVFKGKVGKRVETVVRYSIDFEIVEVE